ncbi:unnamed protein product, partial [Pleuronectes platessa]
MEWGRSASQYTLLSSHYRSWLLQQAPFSQFIHWIWENWWREEDCSQSVAQVGSSLQPGQSWSINQAAHANQQRLIPAEGRSRIPSKQKDEVHSVEEQEEFAPIRSSADLRCNHQTQRSPALETTRFTGLPGYPRDTRMQHREGH